MTTIHDLGWWYWFLTVGLLGAGLFGWPAGIYLAMVLCAVQVGHVVWLTQDLTAFPVQVRVAYLAILIVGIVGTVAVDSLDPVGRKHGAGAGRLLPAGAHFVAGAMEPLAAVVVGAHPADIPLASGGSAILRGHVSSDVARAGASDELGICSAGMPTGYLFRHYLNNPSPTEKKDTMTKLQAGTIEQLKGGFTGEILLPGDGAYDSARQIWNAMIDKRPAIIARCATTSDVVRGVNFARDNGLLLAVRGGGHNIAGNALCDDGLVVDLSKMKAALVDPAGRRVTIEGGATLADLDAATQAHGLATPVGINSTTGIAGLTLGGGFGWLSRKYGMTVDNLESAEVVTAAGEVVRASATEHPDLFWALRGGGGNFGVVTRFEFRLHPVGPDVLSGLIVYPISEAKSVLQQYREFLAKAPEELAVWTVLRKAPPCRSSPRGSTARKSSRSR